MRISALDKNREYYLRNRERIRQKQKEWRIKRNGYQSPNHLFNQRKFHQSPKGIFKNIIGNAKRRGIEVLFTQTEFLAWLDIQPKECSYCQIPETLLLHCEPSVAGRINRRLSVDRIDSLKPYSLDNIVLCCLRCNIVKNDYFDFDTMKKLAKEFIKPRWQIHA